MAVINMNKEPKKPSIIMVVSRNYAPDVQMIRIRRQGKALTRRGFPLTALCWSRRQDFPEIETVREGFTVRRIYVPCEYGQFSTYIMKLPIFIMKSFLYLIKDKQDIISAHDFDTLPQSIIAGKIRNKPVVYDVHDQWSKHPGLNSIPLGKFIGKIIEKIEFRLIENCKAVIASGKGFYSDYEETGKTEVILSLSSPPLNFIPKNKINQFQDDKFVINYVGTVREVEGFKALIRACERVNNRLGEKKVALEIVGGGSTSIAFSKVKEIAEQSSVETILRDWVPYDEINKFYIRASIIYSMFDPRDRNQSHTITIKMMEAMAAGKPVLVTKDTLMGDTAEKLEIGYSLSYGDEKDLENAIYHAAINIPEIKKMGKAARAEFERNWAWEVMVERLDQLYTSLSK